MLLYSAASKYLRAGFARRAQQRQAGKLGGKKHGVRKRRDKANRGDLQVGVDLPEQQIAQAEEQMHAHGQRVPAPVAAGTGRAPEQQTHQRAQPVRLDAADCDGLARQAGEGPDTASIASKISGERREAGSQQQAAICAWRALEPLRAAMEL